MLTEPQLMQLRLVRARGGLVARAPSCACAARARTIGRLAGAAARRGGALSLWLRRALAPGGDLADARRACISTCRWPPATLVTLPAGAVAPCAGAAPAAGLALTLFNGAGGEWSARSHAHRPQRSAGRGRRARRGRSRGCAARHAGRRHAGERTHGCAGREGDRARRRAHPAAAVRAFGAAPRAASARTSGSSTGAVSPSRRASRAAARGCRGSAR